MSIYSGFPTRKDQSKYNILLSKLITTLQTHLLEHITDTIPHNKVIVYSKIVNKMRQFQEHKYLPPKFSQLLDPLCKFIGIACANDIGGGFKETEVDDRYSNNTFERSQKGKVESQYLFKSSNKQRLKSELDVQQHKKIKKGVSLFQEKHYIPNKIMQGLTSHKKNAYQSSFDLKDHRHLPPTTTGGHQNHKMQLTQPYIQLHLDEEVTQNIGLSNKSGHSLKYQQNVVFPSTNKNVNKNRYLTNGNNHIQRNKILSQAQENILKREVPLRQEMRRKLKNQDQQSAKNNNK